MQVLLAIKRLYDLNLSGWFCLLMFIPLVLFIILCCLSGTEGRNRFGDQPKPAFKWYLLMGLLLPILLFILLTINVSSLTIKYHDWEPYVSQSNHISVQFPYPYTIQEKILYDVPFIGISSENKLVFLQVIMIDYGHANPKALKNLIQEMGCRHSITELFSSSSIDLVNRVVIDTKNNTDVKNIKILEDKLINHGSIPGRSIFATWFMANNQQVYGKSDFYIDSTNKRYYYIYAIYTDNDPFGIDAHLIDRYLQSFKII